MMNVSPTSDQPSTTLLGKIPREGDFVRSSQSSAARAFEAWLQEAVESLHAAGLQMPLRTSRFLLASPAEAGLMAGVLSPSQDRVGRKYPLVLLASGLSTSSTAADLDPYLQQLEGLVEEIPAMEYAEIVDRLAVMNPGASTSLPGASQGDALSGSAAEFLATAGVGDSVRDQAYAVGTLRAAAQAGRAGGSATVPCPVRTESHVRTWIALAQQIAPLGQGLSLALWDREAEGPLLLSFGPLPKLGLKFWADPTLPSSQLWPLHTDVEAALDAAEAEYGSFLAAQGTLATLWREVTGKAG